LRRAPSRPFQSSLKRSKGVECELGLERRISPCALQLSSLSNRVSEVAVRSEEVRVLPRRRI
jgi:hypothetical protein